MKLLVTETGKLKLTCNGNFTNADSKRPLQTLWNQIVKTGCATRINVDFATPNVLNSPIRRIWDMIRPIITRRCTCGQKAAALSYFWS